MKKTSLLFISLIFIIELTSCVSYRKTSSLKKEINKNTDSVEKTNLKMRKEFEEKKAILEELKIDNNQFLKEPYPKIEIFLTELNEILDKYEKNKTELNFTKEEIFKTAGNKKKIKSDQPEWNVLEKNISKYEELGKKQSNIVAQFQKKDNELISYINKNKITVVEIKVFLKQITEFKEKIQKSITEVKEKLNETKNKVEKRKNSLSEKKFKDINTILTNLNDLIKKAEEIIMNIDSVLKSISENYKEKTYIISGPGKINMIESEIKKYVDELNKLEKKFNSETKKMKNFK